MTPLLSVADVMIRLGISSDLLNDVKPRINDAISGSQTRLATEMDTELWQGSGYALFFLDSRSHSGIQPAGMFRLLLDQGWLQEEPTISQCSKNGEVVAAIASDSFRVDRDRGLVLLDSDAYKDEWVRVDYVSGFVDDADVKARAPWVREALLAYIPMVMNAGRSDKGEGASAGPSSSSFRLNGELAQGMIARYNRKIGLTLRPALTDWAPAGD